MSSKAKRRLLAIAIAIVLPLGILLALGEFSTRYRERHRDTVPGTMPFLYYRHSRLGHALVRDFDYFGWVHTDSNGFRRGVEPRSRPGAVRILADGGSTTFDSSVERDEETWPARLQFWLDSLSPETPVEVVNIGVPGYRVIDNTIRMQTEPHLYDGDLVLLLQGHNDLFNALRGAGVRRAFTPRPSEIEPMSGLRIWLSANSLLFAKIQHRVNAIAIGRRGARDGKALESDTTAILKRKLSQGEVSFGRDLRFFLSAARTVGIPVALVSPRKLSDAEYWRIATPFAPPEAVLSGYDRYDAVQRAIASEAGVPFIDTQNFPLDTRAMYGDMDPIHFSSAGSDRFAYYLAQELIAAGLLKRRDHSISQSLIASGRPSH